MRTRPNHCALKFLVSLNLSFVTVNVVSDWVWNSAEMYMLQLLPLADYLFLSCEMLNLGLI
jgi:hypothetical protein